MLITRFQLQNIAEGKQMPSLTALLAKLNGSSY